ncbi:MAG: tripartite tricarboxylate transporter substrate binding protein [Alcaligenaceae bacterium]|nr:tripartite tricarboxylate transporter substrate binding protein [Alcaligenaceae bacterium]
MRLFSRRHFIGQAAALALAGAFTLPAMATELKTGRPISIVVPYGSGGTYDTFSRILAKGMSDYLKHPVIVENKPGANGVIGATYVAQAAPDGHTLLMGGTGPVSLNIMLRKSLRYNFDSFDSVSLLFDGPLSIAVPTKLGFKSLQDVIDHSKKTGTPVNYATLGPGSVTHLYGLLLGDTLGIKTEPVAYKGEAPSFIDFIAGLTTLSFSNPNSLNEYVKSGEVDILALSTPERVPSFPNIPTIGELGYPQLVSSFWGSMHAPKGTPPDLLKKLSDATMYAAKQPEFVDMLTKGGLRPLGESPERLDAQMASDREVWGKIIKDNNIVLD